MAGFKLGSSGFGSDCSANCATTTAFHISFCASFELLHITTRSFWASRSRWDLQMMF